ncbi:hypothetical protein [Bacillus sp. ISL-47]|uniref:hypothetical protein n=1 Tax=Bacillus sp. ISL-47 TaxID=2819130 RepID=UPI001BE5499A|nr:hypothetical protein [Bacillus sp. ISL-47]MBT2708684.1 hypothetical protein [Pseudomonas sp. ISL-84]
MQDEEYNIKDEDEQETDPFTQFLFGPNARRNRHLEEEKQGEEDFEKDLERRSRHQNDDWLFGGSRRPQEDDSLNGKVNHLLNNINYEELMNNIDTLMTSASQLKPLLKKASPFLEQFLKK